jgi:hypothetical protein
MFRKKLQTTRYGSLGGESLYQQQDIYQQLNYCLWAPSYNADVAFTTGAC